MIKNASLFEQTRLAAQIETRGLPEVMLDLSRRYNGAFLRLKPPLDFHEPLLVTLRSEEARSILSGTKSALFERPDLEDPFAEIWGDGMLLSDDETWETNRRAVAPEMRHKRMQEVSGRVDGIVKQCLSEASQDGVISDAKRLMDRISMEVLQTLYLPGLLEAYDFEQIRADFEVIEFYNKHRRLGVTLPRSIPGSIGYRFEQVKKRFFDNAHELIEQNRDRGLVDVLTDCGDDRTVANEIVTLIAAGYRTTAALMSWAGLCMAKHLDSDSRLYSRAQDKKPDELLDDDELNSFLNEVLRLYPTAWQVQRSATQEVTINDTTLPAKHHILVSPLLIQRSKRYWKAPDEFRYRERFIKGEGRKKQAYFPFGRGRHTCIGQHLARLEAKLVLIRLAKLGPVRTDTPDPGMKGAVEINPASPIHLQLQEDATGSTPKASTKQSSGCPFH